jgi:hypothetical protein
VLGRFPVYLNLLEPPPPAQEAGTAEPVEES